MKVTLKNNKTATIRLLQHSDQEALYNYLQQLSAESRSRFGPHSFDWRTVQAIFDQPADNINIQRYVAWGEQENKIVAYMLIHQGLIDGDRQRYAGRQQFFDEATTVTFAPSVADDWQSSGLGMAMATFIENDLKAKNIQRIILWGGVQASNQKAVNFYKKSGYRFIDSFWHDGKDNHDMLKEIL